MSLDLKTKLLYPCNNVFDITKNFPHYRYLSIVSKESGKEDFLFYLDTNTNYFWVMYDSKNETKLSDLHKFLEVFNLFGIGGWVVPTISELKYFFSSSYNPYLRKDIASSVLRNNVVCVDGVLTFFNSYGHFVNKREFKGVVILTNKSHQSSSFEDLFSKFNQDLSALTNNQQEVFTMSSINDWENFSPEEIIAKIKNKGWKYKTTTNSGEVNKNLPKLELLKYYKDIDYRTVRLPILEDYEFTDPKKGLWEFWGVDNDILEAEGVLARDPSLDIKDYNIAIDFGSSSTVVAIDKNGKHELLRIGVNDFYKKPEAQHFENPTALEFVDFREFLKAWQTLAYRPITDWKNVRCSHEARSDFRNLDSSEIEKFSSFVLNLKQWALLSNNEETNYIDQQKHKFSVTGLAINNPIKGELIDVDKTYPFDPIELYAWFLGMNINWRKEGIFLNYYMTFPVAYPNDIKEKILSSFRRGLQRSLPDTLVSQPIFKERFSVEELASEPAAYAAAALKTFDIQPTADGVAYAVFDFGGGTTDFDFGIYRWASMNEEDNGYEKVFEHFEPNGDEYLGGENLLENLAYIVFKHNIEKCREHHLTFTQPPKTDAFPGSELFINNTRVSITNTISLIKVLRGFWESGSFNGEPVMRFNLMNSDGVQTNNIEFNMPYEVLDTYLTKRIDDGVKSFFVAMKKAFIGRKLDAVDILLAGNSSRSRWISDIFGITSQVEAGIDGKNKFDELVTSVFGSNVPIFNIHQPLPMDESDFYRPTAKTGVALGLLDLCPGGTIDVINHSVKASDDEAPFRHYVGRLRQGKLQYLALERGATYQEWIELTPINRKVAYLYHTSSPRASTGDMVEGDTELTKVRLDFGGDTEGHKVFVRAIDPNNIEICSAPTLDDVQNKKYNNLKEMLLS